MVKTTQEYKAINDLLMTHTIHTIMLSPRNSVIIQCTQKKYNADESVEDIFELTIGKQDLKPFSYFKEPDVYKYAIKHVVYRLEQ